MFLPAWVYSYIYIRIAFELIVSETWGGGGVKKKKLYTHKNINKYISNITVSLCPSVYFFHGPLS